jgi:hypothetical protein
VPIRTKSVFTAVSLLTFVGVVGTAAQANASSSSGGCSSTAKDYYGSLSVCLKTNSNGSLTASYSFQANSVHGCTSIQLSVFDATTVKTILVGSYSCSKTSVTGDTTAPKESGSFFAVVHAVSKGNYYDSPTLKR